jgi:hypothetical protein
MHGCVLGFGVILKRDSLGGGAYMAAVVVVTKASLPLASLSGSWWYQILPVCIQAHNLRVGGR